MYRLSLLPDSTVGYHSDSWALVYMSAVLIFTILTIHHSVFWTQAHKTKNVSEGVPVTLDQH